MAFLETRYSWHTETKDSNVFRIACLGDSLTFGTGVSLEETWPAQLEKNLNRVAWEPLVEVINAGIAGYSLYDEWFFFLQQIYRYSPDFVIVGLCENDAELFGATQGNYEDHVRECWSENGPYLPYFKAALAEFGRQLSALNIPFLVAFYDISGSKEASGYSSMLQRICADNEFCFVDLASEFTGEFSGNINTTMRASSVDGHPSATAHQIAAQKLTKYITRNKVLPTSSAPSSDPALHRKIFDFGASLFAAGLLPEVCLYRIRMLLDAKRTGKARLALDAAALVAEGAYVELCQAIALEMENCRASLFYEALVEMFALNAADFYNKIESINGMLVNCSKTLFVLDENSNNPALAYYPSPDIASYDNAAFPTVPARLDAIVNSAQAFETNFLKVESPAVDKQEPSLAAIHRDCVVRSYKARTVASRFIKELLGAVFGCKNLASWLIAVNKKCESSPNKEKTMLTLVDISVKLCAALKSLEALQVVRQLHLPGRPFAGGPAFEPFTVCVVTVQCSNEAVVVLTVMTEVMTPLRQPLCEAKRVINDGQPHSYIYKFPLFTFGRVLLSFSVFQNTVVEEVCLYNNSSNCVRFTTIPATQSFSLPFTIVPL
jgi:lysophospholipase L1-like esterase